MVSTWPGSARPAQRTARTRIAALMVGGLAVAYAVLSVWYFYEDFFQYLTAGALTVTDRTGWVVSVDGAYLWTILSPWRLAGAGLAVAMLGVSAASLWSGRPRARALTLLTLWGVLLPQVFWYTEFVADWHRSAQLPAHLLDVLLAGLVVAAVPTALLVRRGSSALSDWNPAPGRGRLLGLAVALCWIGFAASEFVDHSYQLDSWSAYIAAVLAIPMAALAVRGIYHMRAWALWAGMAAAAGLAVVPLAAAFSAYWPTGGYIDHIRCMTAGTDLRVAFSTLLPLAVVWALGAPYFHGFVRRLRA